MTVAIISQTAIAGDGTQATFMGALSAAMLTAGFSLYTTFSASPTLFYVWNYNTNNGYTFQNLLVGAGFTAASTFELTSGSAFNTSVNTSAAWSNQPTTSPTTTLTLTSNFNFISINHPEMRGVIVIQNGTTIAFIGYFRPLTTPSTWWNENNYPFAWVVRSMNPWSTNWSSSNNLSGGTCLQTISSLRPNNIGSVQIIGGLFNASYNPAAGNIITVRTPAMITDTVSYASNPLASFPTNSFDVCDFSTDIGMGPTRNRNVLDYGSNGTNIYQLVDGYTNDTYWSKLYIKVQ